MTWHIGFLEEATKNILPDAYFFAGSWSLILAWIKKIIEVKRYKVKLYLPKTGEQLAVNNLIETFSQNNNSIEVWPVWVQNGESNQRINCGINITTKCWKHFYFLQINDEAVWQMEWEKLTCLYDIS